MISSWQRAEALECGDLLPLLLKAEGPGISNSWGSLPGEVDSNERLIAAGAESGDKSPHSKEEGCLGQLVCHGRGTSLEFRDALGYLAIQPPLVAVS
jgi:hypothetical protein